MAPPADIDELTIAELRGLVVKLFEVVTELERTVAAQRDEIAWLKGLKGRPDIKPGKPSGMAQASGDKSKGSGGRRGRGAKRSPRVAVEDRVVGTAVPEGSRFKGYEDFIVQDLVISPRVIRIRRERWLTPDGKTVVAPLPAGLTGHFGPELRRFVLMQYHQGQVTVARIVAQLQAIGIDISKRQVMRLLNEGQESFVEESRDVLRAGLTSAAWLSVDDTGARHKAKNGYCTQIGNDHFTWFGTTYSKSRQNFLDLLRAGHADYLINDEALDYMRKRALNTALIDLLANHPDRVFADHQAWHAHLEGLGITALTGSINPVMVATEGALWGSIKAHGFLDNAVIISDDAGQFNISHHALCWVHGERLVHKLTAFNDRDRAAQQRVRGLIWDYYRDLKAYREAPSPTRRESLRTRFDRIFRQTTGFVQLDRLLTRLYANRSELLVVLDRPDIPLHTNGSENDIRSQVTKRKISGGTRSDDGRAGRDAFLGIAKTCFKLGISFWDYLGERLNVAGTPDIPRLPDIVRSRSAIA